MSEYENNSGTNTNCKMSSNSLCGVIDVHNDSTGTNQLQQQQPSSLQSHFQRDSDSTRTRIDNDDDDNISHVSTVSNGSWQELINTTPVQKPFLVGYHTSTSEESSVFSSSSSTSSRSSRRRNANKSGSRRRSIEGNNDSRSRSTSLPIVLLCIMMCAAIIMIKMSSSSSQQNPTLLQEQQSSPQPQRMLQHQRQPYAVSQDEDIMYNKSGRLMSRLARNLKEIFVARTTPGLRGTAAMSSLHQNINNSGEAPAVSVVAESHRNWQKHKFAIQQQTLGK